MVVVFFAYFALVSIAAGVLTVALEEPGALRTGAPGAVAPRLRTLRAPQRRVSLGRPGHRLRRRDSRLVPFRADAAEFEDRRALFSLLVPVLSGAGSYSDHCTSLAFLFVHPSAAQKAMHPTVAVLQDGDTYAIGIKMFSEYLLQFEIVGVFLLGAIIGAIVLAKTPKPRKTREARIDAIGRA